jgi:predicted dehydrogenase
MSHQYDARPETLSWRFRSENGGGSVYELIHVFDMLRFINGEVKRVVASFDTTNPHRPTADNPEGIDVDVPDVSGDQSLVETSFYDGMKAAEIVDAAYRSVEESRWIELNNS